MRRAIDETERRRQKQIQYNQEHGITPRTVEKAVADIMEGAYPGSPMGAKRYAKVADIQAEYAALSSEQMAKKIKKLEKAMYRHARDLEFEEAARIRDQLRELETQGLVALP